MTEGIFEDSIFNMFTKADYLKDIEKKEFKRRKNEGNVYPKRWVSQLFGGQNGKEFY